MSRRVFEYWSPEDAGICITKRRDAKMVIAALNWAALGSEDVHEALSREHHPLAANEHMIEMPLSYNRSDAHIVLGAVVAYRSELTRRPFKNLQATTLIGEIASAAITEFSPVQVRPTH